MTSATVPPLSNRLGGAGLRTPMTAARVRALRGVSKRRRRIATALLVVPALLVFVADVTLRGDRLARLSGKHLASYGAAIVESMVLWGLLLFAASARKGVTRWVASLLFVVLAAVVVGGQLYFHAQYSTYLNLDATIFGASFGTSLFGQLRADGENFLRAVGPPLVLAVLLVVVARYVIRPRRTKTTLVARGLAPIAVACALLIPCSYRTVQASTPDVIYFHALGGLLKALTGVRKDEHVRPGLRTPPTLERAEANPASGPRNVLFILTESLRADAHCSGYEPNCPIAPLVNELVPDRFPLRQMRSNASTTAIELAVLWSGLEPIASREALHTSPLLFDFAHAAGYDTAYWTSHHMMFANSRLYVQDLPTKFQCGATDLDPLADIDTGANDDLLAARIERELPDLKEPFFAVAHFGNTHVPYRVDPDDAPFTPWKESKGEADNELYRNYYKNAVYLQDKAIANLISFLKQSEVGERTVIVFTSDHGEAFREHGQLGHTGAILDEEIHVPAWIDAPEGTLSEDEAEALRLHESRPVFHTDITPTMLDLMGLHDAPEFAKYRSTMVGASLLRQQSEPKVLSMTNCTAIWGCAFRNWGMMRGFMKLEAREWDSAWHCYDVENDPEEKRDLGRAACGDLADLAERVHGGLPSAR